VSQITVDISLASKLTEAGQVIDLCDPTGRVLGQFVPLVNLTDWEPVSPEISEEELERRSKSQERRYSTVEVLNHLGKL
jgi:hypothetical protein